MREPRPVNQRADPEMRALGRLAGEWHPQFAEAQGFGGTRVEPGAGHSGVGRSRQGGEDRRLVACPTRPPHR